MARDVKMTAFSEGSLSECTSSAENEKQHSLEMVASLSRLAVKGNLGHRIRGFFVL